MVRLAAAVVLVAKQRKADPDGLVVRLLCLRKFANHRAGRSNSAAVCGSGRYGYRATLVRRHNAILIDRGNARIRGGPLQRLIVCIGRRDLCLQRQRLTDFHGLQCIRQCNRLDNRLCGIGHDIFFRRGVARLIGCRDAEEGFRPIEMHINYILSLI